MSHEEARQALNVYVREEVNFRTLNILEAVIDILKRGVAHSKNIRIEIDQFTFADDLNITLRRAIDMELGPIEPPLWLDRFQHLVQAIREEYNLQHPEQNEK